MSDTFRDLELEFGVSEIVSTCDDLIPFSHFSHPVSSAENVLCELEFNLGINATSAVEMLL